MKLYPFGATLFAWAFTRHCRDLHKADYEVCRSPICRVAYRLELWLWRGGKEEKYGKQQEATR